MTCATCGASSRDGAKFCGECGSRLTSGCPSCGAANPPDQRFCDQCGATLVEAAERIVESVPSAERRLVSVLFADLVGFTALSEHRDAEEVRDLLTRYFETARQVIERFGGTVEKFIGDAVMAVWGTPFAREDDAERAVRAGLDLVEVVRALGDELESSGLSARAAVMTGEAAVTVGAEGQGLVAGDLVNTASRVQALADPGTVLVGERAYRATEASIAYEPAGEHELKGRTELVHLWRAARVTSVRGGYGSSVGLEAPFVGREREVRLVKDLFHATAEEGRAYLVSVVGFPGMGKSRFAWEFEKYIDGVADEIWWHRGRCLPYGEGVSYWALAEMVRMRARIAEGEDPETALPKLRATLDEHIVDDDERAWLEPRLSHLLGLGEHAAPDREDLFSAWRLLFERLAEQSPCALVFEDLQWADSALLDFVEYLLEWSRNHPLFVLTLARPELAERRPDWGAGKRNFHAIYLDPLSDDSMEELLGGLVPGLPDELRARIRAHADGVPLYAVETVRMLVDRGLVERVGDAYRPVGQVESLEVPDSLLSLLAARLDGLEPQERRLLADAAVLGKTFTREALSALSGFEADDLEPLLASLVRKEMLTVEADPWSPERGQYGFMQALVQTVAHDMLSRRDRKARHLAAARHLESWWGSDEEEIVEVVAAHYLEAYRADPGAEDAGEIKATARGRLAHAGERAASLSAPAEAERYFREAAELADDDRERAELLESAGDTARAAVHLDTALELLRSAAALYEDVGDGPAAARTSAALARVMWQAGDSAAALELMEAAFAELSRGEADERLADVAAELARNQFFTGNLARALESAEVALDVAERQRLWRPTAEALNTKGLIIQNRRPEEAYALLRRALELSLEHDLTLSALRAYNNLVFIEFDRDNFEGALDLAQQGVELARRRGDRNQETVLLAQQPDALYLAGRWDEAVALADRLRDEELFGYLWGSVLLPMSRIHAARGNHEEPRTYLEQFRKVADNVQDEVIVLVGDAIVSRADGNLSATLAAVDRVLELDEYLYALVRGEVLAEGVEAALGLGELERAESLLSSVDEMSPAKRSQYLNAHAALGRARLLAARGGEGVDSGYRQAAGRFRELGIPFWLAVTLLEHAERVGDGDGPAFAAEARETFEALGATPWVGRADALLARPVEVA